MKSGSRGNNRWTFLNGWRCLLAVMLVSATPSFGNSIAGEAMKQGANSTTLENAKSAEILHELEKFKNLGSVLYIAAHPDDENTELLTYLARGRNYRTAYLSVTRGDGGQNVLGADLGEKLGVARTQELLAARRLDGAQQFFTRAVDFGFSKNYKETLNVWNKQEVLSDVVRVIRQFCPDVLLTRFTPEPGGTHGHHTASSILALEAFKLAGDPKAFPEQGLAAWQPKRIMWNISRFQKDKAAGIDSIKIDIGGKDASTGEAFMSIAERSRAMHKTQGFDNFQFQGNNNEARIEQFHLLDGAAASADFMDGIDCSWNRFSGGSTIAKTAEELVANFKAQDPAASFPELMKARAELSALKEKGAEPVITEKLAELERIVKDCLGISTRTTIKQADAVPGESIGMQHSVVEKNSKVPVKWLALRFPSIGKEVKVEQELKPNSESKVDSQEILPKSTALTQPWWLRNPGSAGMFAADDPHSIGAAENPAPFPVEYIFEAGGQRFSVADEPVYLQASNTGAGKTGRRLMVIPPVALQFKSEVAILAPAASRSVEVELSSSRANTTGNVHLELPADWKVTPAKQPFHIKNVGEHASAIFTITAPKRSSEAKLVAVAEVNGSQYRNQKIEINYPHIPPQLLQPVATMKAVSLNLSTAAHSVGYIAGAGDSLAENMKEMGCAVKILDESKLSAEQLTGLDAVVLGVRAFNVREKIGAAMPELFDYVKDGGTLIVQYNRPDKLKAEKIAPYDLKISADRVTDEKAKITLLAPEHPVLNKPNKITSADFDGWVQERGIYFPNQWDEHFTPILACNDADEPPTKGALLVARYGKGYYIYTGLVFFRQLPAGVPGAYRLFANMLSINK